MILLTLIAGLSLLVMFVRHQGRSKYPMLPLKLFQSMNFTGANIMTLFLYAALGGVFFFIPFNLVNIQGYSTSQAAASYLPFIIIMIAFSRTAGKFADKFGARFPMTVGPIITAVGYFLLALPEDNINYWTDFFPAMLLQGIGMTMTVAPLTATVMNSVNKENLGIASSVNNMMSRTAGLLAIAVFGIIFIYTGEALYTVLLNDLVVSADQIELYLDSRNLLAKPVFDDGTGNTIQGTVTDIYHTLFLSAYRMIIYVASLLAFVSGIISWMTIQKTKPLP